MTYQYLYCASCGTRRTGHAYQCSVCNSPLRHETPRTTAAPHALPTVFYYQSPERIPAKEPERQPVAA